MCRRTLPGQGSHHWQCPLPSPSPALLQRLRREMKKAIDEAVEERIITALLGDVSPDTKASFRSLYRWARGRAGGCSRPVAGPKWGLLGHGSQADCCVLLLLAQRN